MGEQWENLAEAAGFKKAGQVTTSTTTEAYGGMRVVGPPTMPAGHVAIVSGTSAVIVGPKVAYSLSWAAP
jgi:hypothetical protein